MATILYRMNGEGSLEECRVDALNVPSHLANGWSLSKDFKPAKEETDTNGSSKLSPEEVREAAKKAGVEGFDTKRIATLKKELGYDNED